MSFKARDWSSHPPLLYPDYKSTGLRGATKPLVPLLRPFRVRSASAGLKISAP